MSFLRYMIGTAYGKVTGGKYNGCIIKLGGDGAGISKGKSILDYFWFVNIFKKDIKIYFKDITNYKVISSNFNSSTIRIEVDGEKHILNIVGQEHASEIIGLIEEKANLKKED